MTRVGRTGGLASAWLVLVLAATLGPMILAVSSPGPSLLRLETGGRGVLAYLEPARRSTFAPLSPKIVSDLLGPGVVERLLGQPSRASSVARPEVPSAPAAHSREQPGVEEGLTGKPDVRIEMTVDGARAAPGDTLRYEVTVRNVGDVSPPQFSISSHVPENTTLLAPPGCEGIGVEQHPNGDTAICGPGFPAPGEHGVVVSFGPLRPGEKRSVFFKVLVNADAPKGFLIKNHAHVRGPNLARTSNEVSTRVT